MPDGGRIEIEVERAGDTVIARCAASGAGTRGTCSELRLPVCDDLRS